MDLDRASLDALDWAPLLDALAHQARTPMGARACRALTPLESAAAVRAAHDAVDEVLDLWAHGADLPIGEIPDVTGAIGRAAKGEALDPATLRQVADAAEGLDALRRACDAGAVDRPVLAGLGDAIHVDPELRDELGQAFDPTGQLSGSRWPELADLRERITALHAQIRGTLESILRDDAWADVLQDSFVTLRQDRYVVPVKAHAKRWDLGIVHDTSGSGATVFVEPGAVVEANNRLRVAEGQLEAAERRILAMLSRLVGTHAPALADALAAATRIDLAVARAGLARKLDATRPQVGAGGRVELRAARHPVLLLRGVDVVANDLAVGGPTPVLVLSGPNAGGKTVALKTIGLCAQLVRLGCFVPAAPGSRVDQFDAVLADIGDTQAIALDLSSFTGQLAVLRRMLERAGPGALLLLDEIATGTDPTQGAALAAAVIEALAAAGATVVVTTHYAPLKGLAATRDDFAIAAVEHGGGNPTYKVLPGATGESHGLEVAARVGMPAAILARAEQHLGETEQTFRRALEELDAERDRQRVATRALEAQRRALAERERALEAREAQLRANARALEDQAADGFRQRLKRAEAAIGQVVAELQRAPDHRAVERARATVDALRGLLPETPEPAPAAVAPGDRVRVAGGSVGEVVDLRGDKLTVRIGGLTVQARAQDVERLGAAPVDATRPRARLPKPGKPREVLAENAVRMPGNTLDLRGERVEEALERVDAFLDQAARASWEAVFVLHGHGTGALKQAVRAHLRASHYVRRAAPAGADQGGDAYTVAVLR